MADCSKCSGDCCKYVTLQIDTPKDDIDFEELKWFLAHKNILVYIDHDNQWCVEFMTPCKYQDPKTNLCTIYAKRSKICAEHELEDCEGNFGHEPYYKRAFKEMEDIDAYREEIKAKENSLSREPSDVSA